MNWFTVYSRMYTWTKNGNKKYLPKGAYLLMDPIEEWYGDRNRGLAVYLDNDLNPKVEHIQYTCTDNGYVEFDVKLNGDKNDIVTYRGKRCTLMEAVCIYIQGQISDGWGENGIYVLKGWFGEPVKHINLTYDLYEKDYQESMKLAKKAGEEILLCTFDKYPAYKKIELNVI